MMGLAGNAPFNFREWRCGCRSKEPPVRYNLLRNPHHVTSASQAETVRKRVLMPSTDHAALMAQCAPH